MREELFAELLASVREGGAILRGAVAPARRTVIKNLDVKELRERYDLSQRQEERYNAKSKRKPRV